jgi:hypothetical protein
LTEFQRGVCIFGHKHPLDGDGIGAMKPYHLANPCINLSQALL